MSQTHESTRRAIKKHKRGVILLIVVSLLTLLVLIGVTFVLFANRSLETANQVQRIEEYRERPDRLFDQVVGQMLFDTVSRSALRGHSLLQDLYGPDFITGAVAAIAPVGTGNPNNDNGDQWPSDNNPNAPHGQAFAFQFNVTAPTPANQQMPWLDYYTGRVITFTTGNAAGYSTRILQYDPTPMTLATPQPARLHIEAIETSLAGMIVPAVGDTFIINGAPFNGAGAGFDDTNILNSTISVMNVSAVYANQSAQALTPFPSGDLVALLPHFNGYDPNFGRVYFNATSTAPPPNPVPVNQGLARGGFDEPWDAPDYQNMFLAMVPPAFAHWRLDGDPATPDLPILPSYHRPELVNYWVHYMINGIFTPAGVTTPAEQFEVMAQPYGADHIRNNADDDTPVARSTLAIEQRDRIYNITRCSIFRPMPWDHPNFTGTNSVLPTGPSSPAGTAPRFPAAQAQGLFMAMGYNPTAGSPPPSPLVYDVDNDSDGFPDSIWIDAGFPVVTTADGKRYKPLFAFLIQDLDGRIDVNTHGNLGQIYPRPEQPLASGQFHLPSRPQYPVPGNSGVNFGLAAGPPVNNTPIYLPRGVGFGPAEVDFLNLMMNPATTAFAVNPAPGGPNGPIMTAVAAYENILRGRYSSAITDDFWPAVLPAGAVPGSPATFEPLNQIKHHGVANDFANLLSWYASPPDVWGRGAVVLDWGGQPVYAPFAIAGSTGEMLDNPYELSLSGQLTNTDSPYTLVEIEKLLRYHDYDTQRLPSRLLLPDGIGGAGSVLATSPPGIVGADHTARQRLAGRGAYLPAPAGIPPGTQILPAPAPAPFPNTSWRSVQDVVSNKTRHPGSSSILDMYALKIITSGAANPAVVNAVMNQVVPWELRHGGKFDLNRWLGNGFDSAVLPGQPGGTVLDGVADDPLEAFADPANPPPYIGPREPGWVAPGAYYTANTTPANHNNGVDVNNDGQVNHFDRMYARQLYARHLFCLATLFIDPTFDPPMPHEPTLTQVQRREMFLRRIAQWAINVVDYRDSDAIMTPFEYDVNPWNGWQVDSNLATDGGATAPEMFAQVPGGPLMQVTWPGMGPNNNERRLVWGCEQPDLLITETLAFHQRGVKDTDVAGPDAGGMPDQKRTDPMTRDETVDQFSVPKGSLFIEFYCPRPYRWQIPPQPTSPYHQFPNQKPRVPLELYQVDAAGNAFLQLARLAPGGRPVWRVAMAPMLNVEDGGDPSKLVHPQMVAGVRTDWDPNFPLGRLESSSFDWQDTSLLTYPDGPTPPAPVAPLGQFRYAYFVDASGLPPAELAQSYYNRIPINNAGGFPLLAPGGYAVLGPRPVTYLGSCQSTNPQLLWDSTLGTNGYSNQRIELNGTAAPNVCAVYDTAGTATTRTPGTDIRDVVSIVADYQATPMTLDVATGMPTPWTAGRTWTSGLNITEPLMTGMGANYYPEPLDPGGFTTMVPTPDPGWYDDPDTTISINDGTGFRNTPVEGTDGSGGPVAENAGRPIYELEMQNTGTFEDVSSVYLQRLANPNMPWNPLPSDPVHGGSSNPALLYNPYITVDWATIDVTVFAGDENTDQQNAAMEWIDPDDEDPDNEMPVTAFRTRQRAFQQGYTDPAPGSLLPGGSQQSPWSPVTRNSLPAGPHGDTPNGMATEPYFKVDLSNDWSMEPTPQYTAVDRHTLGYLNSGLGYPSPPQPPAPVPPPPSVRAYLGEPLVVNPLNPAQPNPAPFPWLTFHNRPFANPYEVMLVPASSASRLALELTPGYLSQTHVVGSTVPPNGSNPNPYNHQDERSLRLPFGHLLNFFHTEDTDTKQAIQSMPFPPGGNPLPSVSPHFQRMFDYIEVPSPYASAERWFNPNLTHFDNAGLYRPPFNKMSRFRDAGRININTIFDDQILMSAMGQFPGLDTSGPGSFVDKVFRSRQGYGVLNTPSFVMDPSFPTMFANPFRPLDSADLMPDVPAATPVLSMRRNGIGGRTMPVDATFFRADPDALPPPQPLATPRNRLFDQMADAQFVSLYPPTAPLPPGNIFQHVYRNTERNPYFRYQVMQKLGNTFSTNSNVFAVWITVGYFEVEDNRHVTGGQMVVDAGHPDGLRLGPEIGADSGEIVRHRHFCIIDRSIPVGHVPGQKLNTENCILLRRMIE